MDDAFNYALKDGLKSETEYPYTGRDGSCKFTTGEYHDSKFTDVASCDSNALMEAIEKQPVAVAVEASFWW